METKGQGLNASPLVNKNKKPRSNRLKRFDAGLLGEIKIAYTCILLPRANFVQGRVNAIISLLNCLGS